MVSLWLQRVDLLQRLDLLQLLLPTSPLEAPRSWEFKLRGWRQRRAKSPHDPGASEVARIDKRKDGGIEMGRLDITSLVGGNWACRYGWIGAMHERYEHYRIYRHCFEQAAQTRQNSAAKCGNITSNAPGLQVCAESWQLSCRFG